jgi:glycopeptide antibiotics resistance protein
MNKGLSERIRAFLPACLWGACILMLSLLPGKVLRKFSFIELLSLDKFGHFAFYLVFVYLLSRGFRAVRDNKLQSRDVVVSAGIGILFGTVLEIFQAIRFVGRHFDVVDLIANIIGCAAGMLVVFWLKNSRLWL